MSTEENPTIREIIKNAITALGGKATKKQIKGWINQNYKNVKESSVETHLYSLSVNAPSRLHHGRNSKPRTLNSDYDFLYKINENEFELYDPAKHGNYELIEFGGRTAIAKDGIPISTEEESPLLRFLKNDIVMKANYQPIVMMTLLEKGPELGFTASIQEIMEKIRLLNFDRSDFGITEAMKAVSRALENFVKFNDESATLNPDNFSPNDIRECLKICGQKIAKWHIENIAKNDYKVFRIKPGNEDDDYPYLKEFLDSNTIGMGWHKVGDLSGLSKDEIYSRLKSTYPKNDEYPKGFQSEPSFGAFCINMKQKDIIVLTKAQKEIVDFGIVISDYFHEDNDPKAISYTHRRKVTWLNQGPLTKDDLPPGLLGGSMGTCHEVLDKKQEMIQVLLGEPIQIGKYLLLRNKEGTKWDDISGKKYHFHKSLPNGKTQMVIGTKAIWFDVIDNSIYFLGYGAITKIEDLTDGSNNAIFDNFQIFEKEIDSIERDGIYLKKGTEEIFEKIRNTKIDDQKTWNIQQSIIRTTPSIYGEIIGEDLTDNIEQTNSLNQNNSEIMEILHQKKNMILYGPPGTGKTLAAWNISEDFTSRNKFEQIIQDSTVINTLTDMEYNKFVINKIETEGKSRRYELIKESDSENLYSLKNSSDQIRLGFIFSTSTKQDPNDVYLGVAAKMVNFLDEVPIQNRFLVIINSSTKSFVVLPFEIEQKYARFVAGEGGGKWDSTGKGQHAFHITITENESKLPTRDGTYAEKYYDCNKFVRNVKLIFNRYVRNVTFHPSYSYEEFVEGIRPKLSSKTVEYELWKGIFREICNDARRDPENRYVLVIDEINRGNIPKIFGELITLIEKDKREKYHISLTYSKEPFTVPNNLYIIGTMNTADKSLTQLDLALRRRFGFHELMPDYDLINTEINGINLKELLEKINQKIIRLVGRERQIGHSYFMEQGKAISTIDELQSRFTNEIIPLLQEYFYEDYKKLHEVLGEEFIDQNTENIKKEWKKDKGKFIEALKQFLKNE